jgi:hypothetical protein
MKPTRREFLQRAAAGLAVAGVTADAGPSVLPMPPTDPYPVALKVEHIPRPGGC